MKLEGMREGKLKVGGVEIYYQVLKQIPILIFLHGNGTNHTEFSHQIAHFNEKGTGSLAPDLRGEGRSTWLKSPESYTLGAHVADLESLVEAEGVTEAILVGHSKGAMVAQGYAAEHPDKVKALVLIAASYDFRKTFERTMLRKVLFNLRGLPGPFSTAYNGMVRVISPNGQSDYIDFSAQEFRTTSDLGLVVKQYSRYSPEHIMALHAITAATDTWNTEALAPRIKAPTLIINGKDDFVVPKKTAYELQEMIPGAKEIPLVIIPGRHGVNFQAPELVIVEMEKFFSRKDLYGGRLGLLRDSS